MRGLDRARAQIDGGASLAVAEDVDAPLAPPAADVVHVAAHGERTAGRPDQLVDPRRRRRAHAVDAAGVAVDEEESVARGVHGELAADTPAAVGRPVGGAAIAVVRERLLVHDTPRDRIEGRDAGADPTDHELAGRVPLDGLERGHVDRLEVEAPVALLDAEPGAGVGEHLVADPQVADAAVAGAVGERGADVLAAIDQADPVGAHVGPEAQAVRMPAQEAAVAPPDGAVDRRRRAQAPGLRVEHQDRPDLGGIVAARDRDPRLARVHRGVLDEAATRPARVIVSGPDRWGDAHAAGSLPTTRARREGSGRRRALTRS